MLRKLKSKISQYVNYCVFLQTVRRLNHPIAVVLGTPTHGNLGDSAIALAQMDFLRKANWEVFEITFNEMLKYNEVIHKDILPEDMLAFLGGGNMGDEWFCEEEFRWKCLTQFPNNSTVVFPQTIYYSDTASGQKKQHTSVSYYDRAGITLIAREQVSHQKMKALYPNANILLTPDIVLSMPPQRFDQERRGALLCMRRDKEKKLTDEDERFLVDVLKQADLEVGFTDTVLTLSVTKENRRQLVTDKMRELASAKVVVTDRLHGMVFCALTETPCVVLSNYNHKVKGTYDWISYLPYIRYADTVQEAVLQIPELLQMEKCVFDNTPLQPYFDRIIQEMKKM